MVALDGDMGCGIVTVQEYNVFMIFARQQLEDIERETLAPYAVLSKNSSGRYHQEIEDAHRLCFQKDRDRVIHSRAFRRLRGKTQVFIAGLGDHYRNRLSHSIEVSQVSRDIARTLGLNQDLAETIALAHDLGHPPFGHAGEEALNSVMKEFGSHFEHNEQSKRIVEHLEVVYPHFRGLNLTKEVLEGLMKHKSSWDNVDKQFRYLSLEAQVVNLADEIAYQTHDVDDGLRAGLFSESDVSRMTLWQLALKTVQRDYGDDISGRIQRIRTVSSLIQVLISDVIHETEHRLNQYGIKTIDDVKGCPDVLVGFSEEIDRANQELRTFLFERFYMHAEVAERLFKGQTIVRDVFQKLYDRSSLLPTKFQRMLSDGEKKEVVVKDYVAGMTDKFIYDMSDLQIQ